MSNKLNKTAIENIKILEILFLMCNFQDETVKQFSRCLLSKTSFTSELNVESV